MTSQEQQARTLRLLQQGEIAATETYQQAMEIFPGDPLLEVLQKIHENHRETANELRKLVRHEYQEQPAHGSGTWGTWAKLAEQGAAERGKGPALAALKAGEEIGRGSYEKVLQEQQLSGEGEQLVRDRALPLTMLHIDALTRILAAHPDVS